jgi:hypothetical protein
MLYFGLIINQNFCTMKTFDFYKDNRADNKFTLTFGEVKEKFIKFMKTKKKSWLEYYCFNYNIQNSFIGTFSGLCSTMEEVPRKELCEMLNECKWDYLNKLGIK